MSQQYQKQKQKWYEKGVKDTKEKVIKLFKEDSIYTGAVIKLEINSKI